MTNTKQQDFENYLADRFLGEKQKDNFVATIFLYILLFLMIIVLLFVSFAQLCQVRMTSMLPTLNNGDNVLITNAVPIKRGDIVIVSIEEDGVTKNLIKRAIALGGDSFIFKTQETKPETVVLQIREKGDTSFVAINEDYILEPMLTRYVGYKFLPNKEYTVDPGSILALGDNRNNSNDSRFYGYFPSPSIVGKMFYHVPPNSFVEKLLFMIYGTPQE